MKSPPFLLNLLFTKEIHSFFSSTLFFEYRKRRCICTRIPFLYVLCKIKKITYFVKNVISKLYKLKPHLLKKWFKTFFSLHFYCIGAPWFRLDRSVRISFDQVAETATISLLTYLKDLRVRKFVMREIHLKLCCPI